MTRGLLLAAAAVLSACGGPPSPPDSGADQPLSFEQIELMLDSAAEAFQAEDIQRADSIYARVVASDSALAAGWFGLFITRRALGDTAAADSALARAKRLADS